MAICQNPQGCNPSFGMQGLRAYGYPSDVDCLLQTLNCLGDVMRV